MSQASTPVAAAHLKPNPEWLALHVEDVREPDLPIIDAHHHLWHIDERRYLAEEFSEDLNGGHNVVATIHAQCYSGYRTSGPLELRPVGETELMVLLAGQVEREELSSARVCAGIIGSMDVLDSEVADALIDAHRQAASGRFCGMRMRTAWHEDVTIRTTDTPPGVISSDHYRRIAAALQRSSLCLDAWVYQNQLSELADLCADFPDLTIIVNHLGGPLGIGSYGDRPEEAFAQWRASMRRLAGFPNTLLKFGGLGMRVNGFGYHLLPVPPSSQRLAADWSDHFRTCIDAFSPARCMFESNFPVDKASFSYTTLWNAFKRLSADLSADERQDLFSANARHIYGLQ